MRGKGEQISVTCKISRKAYAKMRLISFNRSLTMREVYSLAIEFASGHSDIVKWIERLEYFGQLPWNMDADHDS